MDINITIHFFEFLNAKQQALYAFNTLWCAAVCYREAGVCSACGQQMAVRMKFALFGEVYEVADAEVVHLFYFLPGKFVILVPWIFASIYNAVGTYFIGLV